MKPAYIELIQVSLNAHAIMQVEIRAVKSGKRARLVGSRAERYLTAQKNNGKVPG